MVFTLKHTFLSVELPSFRLVVSLLVKGPWNLNLCCRLKLRVCSIVLFLATGHLWWGDPFKCEKGRPARAQAGFAAGYMVRVAACVVQVWKVRSFSFSPVYFLNICIVAVMLHLDITLH